MNSQCRVVYYEAESLQAGMSCGLNQPMIHAMREKKEFPVGHEILAEDKEHEILAEYKAGFWKYISVLYQNPAFPCIHMVHYTGD